MPVIVGVRFEKASKIYYFSPGNIPDLKVDDWVIVETARGYEAGQVVIGPREVSQSEVVGHLKPVTRRATVEDLLSKERYALREAAALQRCRKKVAEYGLPMKVVGAEYSFDGSSLTFFFTSEKRVDFRELVRELAHIFRTRIELRQIGVRDEARLIGGIGPCGRCLCCITHLQDFRPVSIKMAKQQDLPLSPMEISGLCGRLLCCLSYEDEIYREAKAEMPQVGEIVNTEYGRGRVCSVNVIKQTLNVELEGGTIVEVSCAPAEEQTPEPPPAPQVEREPAPVPEVEPALEQAPAAEERKSPSRSRRRRSRRSRGGQRQTR